MTKRANGSIGQQAGAALDALVQPAQTVVNSVRETVSSAVSGMAGFMKEPSEAMPRRAESALRTAAEIVRPRPSRVRGGARRTTARRPSAARARARR